MKQDWWQYYLADQEHFGSVSKRRGSPITDSRSVIASEATATTLAAALMPSIMLQLGRRLVARLSSLRKECTLYVIFTMVFRDACSHSLIWRLQGRIESVFRDLNRPNQTSLQQATQVKRGKTIFAVEPQQPSLTRRHLREAPEPTLG